jgi:hypothetical protein
MCEYNHLKNFIFGPKTSKGCGSTTIISISSERKRVISWSRFYFVASNGIYDATSFKNVATYSPLDL